MFSIVRVQTKKVKERKKKPLRHCREKNIEKPSRSMPIAAQSPHSPKKRSKKHPTISTELRAGKRAVRALRTREEGATCGMLVRCLSPARCLYRIQQQYTMYTVSPDPMCGRWSRSFQRVRISHLEASSTPVAKHLFCGTSARVPP